MRSEFWFQAVLLIMLFCGGTYLVEGFFRSHGGVITRFYRRRLFFDLVSEGVVRIILGCAGVIIVLGAIFLAWQQG